jgi:hypothetical protein
MSFCSLDGVAQVLQDGVERTDNGVLILTDQPHDA